MDFDILMDKNEQMFHFTALLSVFQTYSLGDGINEISQ